MSTFDIFAEEYKYSRAFAVLNSEFVAAFKASGIAYETIQLFVDAMDHLDELTKTRDFKNGRMLHSPDLNINAQHCRNSVETYNKFAKVSGNKFWRVVPLNKQATDCIQTFLDEDYISAIYLIMLRTGYAEMPFTLDGLPYEITINIDSPHIRYSILEYRDFERQMVVRLPFLKDRLRLALYRADLPMVS